MIESGSAKRPASSLVEKPVSNNRRLERYLLYAIGEILLVMIGILLALQVNNWNEDRKIRILEAEILEDLLINLKRDLTDITSNIQLTTNTIRSTEILLDQIEADSPYHDSLAIHLGQSFWWTDFLPTTSAYEVLKSKGLDIIRDKSLRTQLQELYEFSYQRTSNLVAWEMEKNDQYTTVAKSYFRFYTAIDLGHQIGRNSGLADEMIPINFQVLKESSEFTYHLSLMDQVQRFINEDYKMLETKISKLIGEVENKLDQ